MKLILSNVRVSRTICYCGCMAMNGITIWYVYIVEYIPTPKRMYTNFIFFVTKHSHLKKGDRTEGFYHTQARINLNIHTLHSRPDLREEKDDTEILYGQMHPIHNLTSILFFLFNLFLLGLYSFLFTRSYFSPFPCPISTL